MTAAFEQHDTRDRILRLREVKEMVGLSKTTIYARIAHGAFPRPISLRRHFRWLDKVGGRCVVGCSDQ